MPKQPAARKPAAPAPAPSRFSRPAIAGTVGGGLVGLIALSGIYSALAPLTPAYKAGQTATVGAERAAATATRAAVTLAAQMVKTAVPATVALPTLPPTVAPTVSPVAATRTTGVLALPSATSEFQAAPTTTLVATTRPAVSTATLRPATAVARAATAKPATVAVARKSPTAVAAPKPPTAKPVAVATATRPVAVKPTATHRAVSADCDLNNPAVGNCNCSDFATQAEAQAFFIRAGGPANDRHGLDGNNDGQACEKSFR